MADGAKPPTPPRRGFTLLELLVVMAVVGLLVAILVPAIQASRARSAEALCGSRIRGLGQAIQLYTGDHRQRFPRSWHSAGAHREPGWARSVAPYLGLSEETIANNWTEVFNRHYRSPVDDETDPFIFSYALNVHFELDPAGDDYTGSPATWRTVNTVPSPARTILLAQTRPIPYGDHLMCHQWSGLGAAEAALNHEAHRGRAHYLFVDGHVELLPVEATFDPPEGLNRWNPGLAGGEP